MSPRKQTNPLQWDRPIVDKNGLPSPDFMRKWQQQQDVNTGIPNTGLGVSKLLDMLGAKAGEVLLRGSLRWSGVSVSTALDVLGTTRGSIIYRGATGWVILPPGTVGQVLLTGGAGADPAWGASAGGGGGAMLPLVTGELPGPIAIADPSGQFIGVPL